MTLPRRASVKELQFCADRLVSVDSKNELSIWDLQTQKKVAAYSPPGVVMSLVTDPMLDWAFIGLQNGEIIAYDLDREKKAPLKLPNFWRERNPRARILSVVSMQLHPRDIGQLLIGYTEGAVIYSFKQNRPIKYFEYEVPIGAPGGNADPLDNDKVRKPRLTHVFWHPTGTFIGTAHDDASLVFWDPKDGRVVMARTLTDGHVDQPGRQITGFGNTPGTLALKEPFTKIAWCCRADNPDHTGILVAGGVATTLPQKGLTFLDLGVTPVYATSTWPILTDHFDVKKQHLLPTPEGAEIVTFCLVPRTTPHFAGAQDPIAVIALLTSGELVTLSFPSGYPISPTNQLHPSVTFVHPFVTLINATGIDRGRWLGMIENRRQEPPLLRGGAEGIRPLKRYEARNIIQMAHGDGTIRIWDAGHVDEIENSAVLQVDVARSLDRFDDVNITALSMGGTGELGVGTSAGEVVIYRWGGNKLFGREDQQPIEMMKGGISIITARAEPTLKEGLQPFALYDMAHGPISALKVSDVGFVGIGSEAGFFSVIDLRGPAVIFNASMADFIKPEKRSSFMKKSTQSSDQPDWPVAIEFGVMTLEGDNYSSIACFVGTNLGKLATFKILPQANGGYTAQYAGVTALADKIISITPIIADTGKVAAATGETVGALRTGQQTHGTLVVGKSILSPECSITYRVQSLKPKLASSNPQPPKEPTRNGTTSSAIRHKSQNAKLEALHSLVSSATAQREHTLSQRSKNWA